MDDQVAKKINDKFSTYPKRIYPKGQILLFANENPEHIFFVVSGKVRQYDVSYRGDEVIINVFSTPAFFPMSWAVNRSPNKYFFKTETDTELHIIPVDDVLQFVTDNPDVLLDLLSRIYRGMDGLLGRVVHLMSGTAKSRLIYELITECRRFGIMADDGSYTLAVTEVDLAARSGLSRETVSREMQKLKRNEWITLSGKMIKVTNLTALQQALGKAL